MTAGSGTSRREHDLWNLVSKADSELTSLAWDVMADSISNIMPICSAQKDLLCVSYNFTIPWREAKKW
jgi:hypothetical protein